MPQAHTQHGHAAREGADHVHRDTGVVGGAGAGRDAQMRGRQCERRGHRDLIVAAHVHLGAQHQEGLHQVVGEGIVVVDQQQTRLHRPSSASASARTMAPLLASTSSCSASGTLSATMPAPAWKLYSSPWNTSVRMVMAWSMSPRAPK